MTYLSETTDNRFAVFSEVFYKRGWRAWIDNKEAPIIRTNYVLRGLSVPAGRHIIRFFFRPLSFYLGRQLQWMASIIFMMMFAGAVIVAVQMMKKMPLPDYPKPMLQPA
ncbi:YfhO family protein [Puia sp. P3]|uniref:YfhO family protein n=1 Tax=Puia sp. P3 TaxID=3423952 RepID=UPI003D673A37